MCQDEMRTHAFRAIRPHRLRTTGDRCPLPYNELQEVGPRPFGRGAVLGVRGPACPTSLTSPCCRRGAGVTLPSGSRAVTPPALGLEALVARADRETLDVSRVRATAATDRGGSAA